jgi:hypothetical protein
LSSTISSLNPQAKTGSIGWKLELLTTRPLVNETSTSLKKSGHTMEHFGLNIWLFFKIYIPWSSEFPTLAISLATLALSRGERNYVHKLTIIKSTS